LSSLLARNDPDVLARNAPPGPSQPLRTGDRRSAAGEDAEKNEGPGYAPRASVPSWDASGVIEAIRDRQLRGLPLASSKVPKSLIRAGLRYFGS
jgi:hypothetical protein